MAKILKFYGASDDCFECDGDITEEQDDCAQGRVMAYRLHSAHAVHGGVMIVTAQYAPKLIPGACWVIGVTLDDEDVPLPPWPMRWETAERAYSPMLVIEAPDDVDVAIVAEAPSED